MRGGVLRALFDGIEESFARLMRGDPLAWGIVGGCVALVVPLVVAAVVVHRKHKAEAARGSGKIRWKDGKAPPKR
jgi:hypothetical protein